MLLGSVVHFQEYVDLRTT